VEPQNRLGIYLSKNTATVVCLGLEGGDYKVFDCFSVSAEQRQERKLEALAGLVAKRCAEKELHFSEVAVALDCAMFTQHNVHSEFNDPKQIAATVRFDTEEALAMDISDVAIAFKTTSSNQTGSQLVVFTAQRKILSDLLVALQRNNIDPATVEPDVNCLSRFVQQNILSPEDSHPLFCMLSRRSGYFIAFAKSKETLAVRTFLINAAQDRTELLAAETPVTMALVGTDEPIDCLKVFDSAGSVNYRQLSEKLGIEAASVDLTASAGAGPQTLSDCDDAVDFAIAYGAALAHLEKEKNINFRSDFMPYQGKKIRLQKALKFAGISVTVLMLAVGLYAQAKLLQKNNYRARLQEKFEKQYSAVMFGKKMPAKLDPVKKLKGELRRIKDVKSGQLSITGEESISTKLTLVFEAFNKCAKQTNLNIDSISITSKSITITGNTSNRKNTLVLRKELEKTKLGNLQEHLEPKGRRDNFRITIVPKK